MAIYKGLAFLLMKSNKERKPSLLPSFLAYNTALRCQRQPHHTSRNNLTIKILQLICSLEIIPSYLDEFSFELPSIQIKYTIVRGGISVSRRAGYVKGQR